MCLLHSQATGPKLPSCIWIFAAINIALLKRQSHYSLRKRHCCKPTRIHCAWCVQSHRRTHPYTHCHITEYPSYDYCAQVICTRTTNRMLVADACGCVWGVVSCGVAHSVYGWVLYSGGLFSKWIIRLPWARLSSTTLICTSWKILTVKLIVHSTL